MKHKKVWHVAACLLCLSVLWNSGCQRADKQVDSGKKTGNIHFTIDFNGHRQGDDQHIFTVAVSGDVSVMAAMMQGRAQGDFDFEMRGSDETAFVTSVLGVRNQGRGKDNWVFRVNGRLADRSCGMFKVSPGDLVEWRLGSYAREK